MTRKVYESPVTQSTLVQTSPFSIEFPGPALFIETNDSLQSTPGTLQSAILTGTPGAGLLWKLRQVEVVCGAYALFTLKVNARIIKKIRTGPASPTISLAVVPWEAVTAADTITLDCLQESGPASSITARVYYTEE